MRADAKVRILLQPPILRSLGLKRKIRVGRWAVPLLRALHAGRHLRGHWYDFRPAGVRSNDPDWVSAKLAVTYHPAFLLRDPRQKKEAWKDLQMVMRELCLPMPAKGVE